MSIVRRVKKDKSVELNSTAEQKAAAKNVATKNVAAKKQGKNE